MSKYIESDTVYGSDLEGLIHGYRFGINSAAQPINLEQAVQFLSEQKDTRDGFIWLHFSLSNSSSESWMRQNLPLPDTFYDSLHSPTGSTRLEQDEDALVAVINDVLFDFKFDPSSVATATLCLRPHLFISTRLKLLRSLDQLRMTVRSGKTFRSSVELFAHLLEDQADGLVDILRQSTAKVDKIEDRILANQRSTSRSELGLLRRVLVRLQRLLAPEPAAFFRLLNKPPEWIAEEDVIELRQAAEGFSVAVNDIFALVERVKILQEELAALVSEQSNRTLFVLTVVTVLALPINLITGMFGMNVGGVPFGEHEHGFTWMFFLLLTLTALLAVVALRRLRRKD